MLSINVRAQPFQIGHATVTLVDTLRSNRIVPVEIYYPADVAGNNLPVSTGINAKFPAISFGHGFVMTWDAYQHIWNAVVPEGFIIAFPKTEGGLGPSHTEFGKDLAFVLSALYDLGQDTSSLFYDRVDSMNCVMGHSMGGGSAFLAAQFNPSIKTMATLAPAETNPSAIEAAASLSLPSLIIAGGNDCVTPPPSNQIPMYESLQSSCKTYISINGASHCQMADYNLLCSFGEGTCSPGPTISRAEQHMGIARYLLPWLKYELKNDCFSGAQFDSLITTDTSIVFQTSCLLCTPSSVNGKQAAVNIDIFPNPFHNEIFIRCHQSETKLILVDLYGIDGGKICSQPFSCIEVNEELKLNINPNLPAGMYLLKVTIDRQVFVQKIYKR